MTDAEMKQSIRDMLEELADRTKYIESRTSDYPEGKCPPVSTFQKEYDTIQQNIVLDKCDLRDHLNDVLLAKISLICDDDFVVISRKRVDAFVNKVLENKRLWETNYDA